MDADDKISNTSHLREGFNDMLEGVSNQQKHNSSELSVVPCTKFPIFYVDNGCGECAIQAVVLNYWDNICGPRIHSAWTISSDGKSGKADYVDWDAVGFMGRQILCGAIMKCPGDLFLEAKFYDSMEKKIALAAVVFGAIDQGEMKAHSLCLIPDYEKLKQFLQWKDVCFQWLTKCVLQLRVTLANNATTGYTIVKEDLRRLVEIMKENRMKDKLVLMDIKVNETFFSSLEDPSMFEFVHRSLVAFFCQGRQAVVVGSNPDQVNKMVKTLMMFVLPHRSHRCSLFKSNSIYYAPELLVQGMCKSESHMQKLLTTILFCPQPTALIDCDKKEAFIISWCEEYEDIRRKFLDDRLSQLWSECPSGEVQFGEIFKPVKVSRSLLHEFLSELSCLPERLKKPYVFNFLKSLNRKALLLSHCLDNLRQNPKRLSGSNQSDTEMISSIIRSKLSLASDWDVHIISSSPYNLPVNYY